jgi:hypothetical protein
VRKPAPEKLDNLEVVEDVDILDEVDEVVDAELVPGDRPRKKRRRPRAGEERAPRVNTRGLEQVNLGLGFHYARIVIVLFGLLAMIAIMFALGAMGARAAEAAKAGRTPNLAGLGVAVVLALIVSIAVNFVAPALGLVGSILCAFAPPQSEAKGFILASLVLDLLALPLAIVLQFVRFIPAFQGVAALGAIPSFFMGFIAWALFMLFLKQLCSYLGEQTMAEEATAILGQGILILVVAPITVFLLLILIRALACCGLIPAGLLLFYGLYYIFLFLRRQLDLIGSLRQVIQSRF